MNSRSSATPTAVDPATLLTSRLEQLRDRTYMMAVLQRALAELSSHHVDVLDFEITYCKVKPWRDVSLALSIASHDVASSKQLRQIVSGRMWATVDDARAHLSEELATSPVVAPDPTGRGATSAVLVPEIATVLRLFPADSGLAGLTPATRRADMLPLLHATLPDCRDDGWRIRELEFEPVHYKPGRLCTLRYTLTLDHPRRSDRRQLQLFGKVYRDDRWQESYEILTRTWNAALASDGAWSAALPIAAVGAWRFVVQGAVPGDRFRRALADLTHDDATPDEIRQIEGHLEAVARAVRSMQRSRIVAGPHLGVTDLLGIQQRNLDYLRGTHRAMANDLERLRTGIERLAGETTATELGLSHGDFADGNVMLDGDRVGIIDFDRICQAEPAYDVAYFLTHLTSFALRHPRRAAHLRPLCSHFRAAYLELAPEVSPRRLALYEALDLSAYVLRNFRKQSHQARWLKWATGQIESAWERLDYAIRTRRNNS